MRAPSRFRDRLERAKQESTFQILFRCARLLNDAALARIRDVSGVPVRAAHTAILPHLDLDGTRPTELARRMGISKQAVGQLLDELQAMGMVERIPDPADGRAVLVRFSARGRRGLLHGLAVLRGLEVNLAGQVGKARMKALHGTLARLLSLLEAPKSGKIRR